MDLLDCYFAAVRRHLPAERADDIVAELRDDLLSRIEAREDSLGRPLTREETAAELKEAGHPLLVASRYRPHQWLIGPEVFPFYMNVVRIVAIVVILSIGVGAAASAVFDHRSGTQAAMQAMAGIWTSLLTSVGIVTIVFALLERNGFPADHIRKWRPEDLPEVKDKQPSAWESAFEVAMTIAVILWWAGWLSIPYVQGDPTHLMMVPDPVWAAIYWPVLALLVARLAHNLVQFLRPRWKAVRMALSVATTIGAITLLVVIYGTGHWITPVSTTMAAGDLAELDRSVNQAIQWGLMVAGAIRVFQCAREVWRIATTRDAAPALA